MNQSAFITYFGKAAINLNYVKTRHCNLIMHQLAKYILHYSF